MLWQRPGTAAECRPDDSTSSSDCCVMRGGISIPDEGLPGTFLVRSGQRKLSPRAGSELADVFLPDERGRARSLQEYGKPILEMEVYDALRTADALRAATGVNRASMLEERYLDRWRPVDRAWLTESHRSTKRDTPLGSRSPCSQSGRTEVRYADRCRRHRRGVKRPTGFDVLASWDATTWP